MTAPSQTPTPADAELMITLTLTSRFGTLPDWLRSRLRTGSTTCGVSNMLDYQLSAGVREPQLRNTQLCQGADAIERTGFLLPQESS